MSESPAKKGPLLLLDGMSLAFRAYFALPPDLATTNGVVTNAVHGFTSMLVYLIREHQPSGFAVAFDRWEPTFRDEMVADYKAGRNETPDDLLPQFDMIRQVVQSLAIPVIEVVGFEADDVLATLATQARDRQCEVIVVTGDRDCFQLVDDPFVRVLYNRRGVSDYSLYDEEGIIDRTGVTPAIYPMLASLRGDPSDNLPGVPGVGEKTAAKLLNTYGDLDGIFSHLDELTPKLQENLRAHEEQARSNFTVTPLIRDVPLPVSVDQLTLGGWDLLAARELFFSYELKTIWQRLIPLFQEGRLGLPAEGSEWPAAEAAPPATKPKTPASARKSESSEEEASPSIQPMVSETLAPLNVVLERPGSAKEVMAGLTRIGATDGPISVAARFVGDPGRSPLIGVVLVAANGEGVWLTAAHLDDRGVCDSLSGLLDGPIAGHQIKEVFRSLLALGIDPRGLVMDTAVAAYLIDPSIGEYTLATIAGTTATDNAPTAASLGQFSFGTEGEVDVEAAACAEAATVTQLVRPLRTRLEAEGLTILHDDIECPLVRVLARMEAIGISVDTVELRRISDELTSETKRLEAEIHRHAGHEFNVNSTPQLRTVLYDELGLSPGRKTKTGFSTDARTLETLRGVHEVVDTLLAYREVEKLRSTYGESLLSEVAADGRIHASFRQTVARTGRLSSDRPNLHNIPVRSELGKQFRRAFVPADGWSFLVADYNQIELRVIAHLSGDELLREALTSGTDVHRVVAGGIYGVSPEEVSHTERERAKMVSYGLAYGMESYGLSQRLSIGVEEAAEIMDRYFSAFPHVKGYMDDTVTEARLSGMTRTEFGRIRPLPDLNVSNYRLRQAAERQAMNAGIQGLAADIFKVALVRLDAALERPDLQSRLVLQVHDEVIVEVAPGEEDEVSGLTASSLEGAADLGVPLTISMSTGSSWAAAKA